MNAHVEVSQGISVRLNELLKDSDKYKAFGKGLAEEISKATGYSYTAARKWLVEDTLPKSPTERQSIAAMLDIDLMYWEYGVRGKPKSVINYEINNLFHLKVANEVLAILYDKSIRISDDKKIEIEMLALSIAEKTNISEPDRDILESLIRLAM